MKSNNWAGDNTTEHILFMLERGSPIAYSNLNTFEDDDKYPNRVDTDNI